jgi:hypothetical protein
MSAERPVGPHIDQNARDVLDDFGLVATALGTAYTKELMG